ncbi:hypothetical protein KIMH_05110 [Bombiscardovia apis]|uniref:GrpB family protein n=1 Tax=Bombiscardovia apis TaxID=2932182 RepID=A0ABM8BC30_9BIFI|nr:hypothetical protein KIMH_05110 [Bombiscardovia apis]
MDIDLVYRERSDLAGIVRALAKLGYKDEGDLGIEGREAFAYDELPGLMAHHLYACPQDSAELKRHLTFRDYLREHPQAVEEYSQAKREAAQRFPDDIDNYIAYKSPAIEKLYRSCGLLSEGK